MEEKPFVAECDHLEPVHNVIEFVVTDEEGRSNLHILIQCRLCGRKIN